MYEFPVDAVLKALKFGRRLHYGPALGHLLVRSLDRLPADVDALLPVPLHWGRQAWRGFNQATELCKPVAKAAGLPVIGGVVRRRSTPPQSGLAASKRRRNLRGVFVVRKLPGYRHVIIVDDVITTGATVRELALTLRRSGVKRVSALAVARASGLSRG